MATILDKLASRWRGSPWLPLPYVFAIGLFLCSAAIWWWDLDYSRIGVEALPINSGGPLFVLVLAAMLQLVQVVFGYSLAGLEMDGTTKVGLQGIVAICIVADTVTNISYFYDGTGWVSASVSALLAFCVFTLFSEFSLVFSAGFLWALWPDFRDLVTGRARRAQQQQRPQQPPRRGQGAMMDE